jgi:ADP-heptose:LPS heptosyltransferase
MDKIIFFNMNQIGDLLFALPVMKAARIQYPNAKIYCVIKENLKDLLNSANVVDEIFVKGKSFKEKINLINKIKKENIQTAILFSESPESLLTAFCSEIKNRIGFKTSSLSFLLTKTSQKTGVPSLKNNISLATVAGIKNVQTNYLNIIKENSQSKEFVENWLTENKLEKNNYVVISMGASAKRQEKCLHINTWIEVINKLQKKNINVVISYAQQEEENIKNIISKCQRQPYIFSNGLLNLVSLLISSKMFIGIDSGIMHLAASLGVKCVGIFGKTDPNQIGPQPLENHIIIKNDNIKNITSAEIVKNLNF